jgi:hypothetical protein
MPFGGTCPLGVHALWGYMPFGGTWGTPSFVSTLETKARTPNPLPPLLISLERTQMGSL